MKKLLAILATTTLTVSSGALLVSCSSGLVRQDKLKYNIDVLKQILFDITGDVKWTDKENSPIDSNLGDYLTESKVNEIIQSTLDQTLGLQSSFESTNANLKSLKSDAIYKGVNDFNEKSYTKQSNSIAQKKLFKEYTTALSNNESFDFQKLMDGFSLGVTKETKVTPFGETSSVNIPVGATIKFGTDKKIWATSVENIKDTGARGIPTVDMFTAEYSSNKAQFYVNNGKSDIEISALTALSLRFQDYFVNQLESDIISNIMVMSHMTSKMFRYRDSKAYLNPTNAFTNKLQDFNPSNNDWKTNVKMIWTVKYDKSKMGKGESAALVQGIKKFNDSSNKEKSIKNILTINDSNTNELGITPILKDTSYDSYFGLSGFQGIKFDTFGDDPTSGKTWADKVNDQQNGARIIYNTDLQPGFSSNNPNYNEIVVVLPIYFIELMTGNSKDKDNNSSEKISRESAAEVTPTDVYSIKDAKGGVATTVQLGRAGSSTEDIWQKWNGFKNNKGSVDVRDTLAQDDKRENLLNELMYMACTNTSFIDAAKRDIYTKYLDKDTIYYSGIWDMVKKYIDDEEDEDM